MASLGKILTGNSLGLYDRPNAEAERCFQVGEMAVGAVGGQPVSATASLLNRENVGKSHPRRGEASNECSFCHGNLGPVGEFPKIENRELIEKDQRAMATELTREELFKQV